MCVLLELIERRKTRQTDSRSGLRIGLSKVGVVKSRQSARKESPLAWMLMLRLHKTQALSHSEPGPPLLLLLNSPKKSCHKNCRDQHTATTTTTPPPLSKILPNSSTNPSLSTDGSQLRMQTQTNSWVDHTTLAAPSQRQPRELPPTKPHNLGDSGKANAHPLAPTCGYN
jgi:hypothetical protein